MDEKARILIVDDNTNLRKSMSLILSRKGYSVTTAKTACVLCHRHVRACRPPETPSSCTLDGANAYG